GVCYLTFLVNPLTAALGAITLLTYLFVYTPMKRVSSLNTVIGAIPGAIPPMMGWTAATGVLSIEAIALFAILFIWQMPHFLAIADTSGCPEVVFRIDHLSSAAVGGHDDRSILRSQIALGNMQSADRCRGAGL